MALIQTSALISDIKGRIAGNTFQRSSSGLVMRRQGGQVNRSTQAQNDNRNILSRLQISWQGLSDQQRLLWNTYAIFKNQGTRKNLQVKLSGHQLFIRENTIRLMYNAQGAATSPVILTAPILIQPQTPPTIVSVTNASTHLYIVTSFSPVVGTSFLVWRMSAGQSPSQQSGHVKRKVFCPLPAASTTQDLYTPYITAFGALPLTLKFVTIDLAIYVIANGSLSSYSTTRIAVS